MHASGLFWDRPIAYQPLTLNAFKEGLLTSGMDKGFVEIMFSEWKVAATGGLSLLSDAIPIITGKAPRSFRQFLENHKSWFV